jgi:hypothetical protein
MAKRKAVEDDSSPEDESEKARKVGFLISAENDFKLTVLARKQRKPRSTMVNDAITELTRGVVISFRGKSSEAGEAA